MSRAKLFKKLMNVQSKLKVNKTRLNKFGGYNFRNAEDIMEAVKPLLAEEGLAQFVSDEIVFLETRFYVQSTVTVVDVETGEEYSVTASARESKDKKGMDVAQITGASSSYARKYALNGMYAIDDGVDADSQDNRTQGTTSGGKEKPEESEEVTNLRNEITKIVKGLTPAKKKELGVKLNEAGLEKPTVKVLKSMDEEQLKKMKEVLEG